MSASALPSSMLAAKNTRSRSESLQPLLLSSALVRARFSIMALHVAVNPDARRQSRGCSYVLVGHDMRQKDPDHSLYLLLLPFVHAQELWMIKEQT